jgi:dipeptidyl aminopeptidase/acylaminoacyl peptidase/energy-coupling factor transporter ATP-binding protein EcfA2
MQTLFNPFPGLRPFEAHENHLFFGRDGQSDELLTRLRRHRFLAVVGTSGSGKSSLVRAGLLPGLYGGLMTTAGSRWRIGVFRPGNQPIANLAETLNAPEVFGRREQVQQTFTETVLRRGAVGLVEVVQEARMPRHDNLLVVVDQFEELFRFKQASPSAGRDDEAAAFVKLLLEAAKQRETPIYVVLTMRSDYLGDCAQFRDLPEAINDGQYLIPRMTRDQRREAITGPIAVGGAKITERLVNRLLNDVGDNPDQLPILQHALMRTWNYWAQHHENDAPIDLPHYEAIGGMEKALSLHADEAYYELTTPRRQAIAEKLFKALTEKGEDNREIRRPTLLRDACELAEATETEVAAIVEIFRRPGRTLLMPPSEVKLHAGTLIDISHESLIRNWERLKKWVDEEAQSAQIYRRLAETTALYRDGQAGLWRDPDLQIALDWQKQNRPNQVWAQRYNPQFGEAIKFLQKSQTAREAEIAEKEAIRQRELQQAHALAEEQRKRAEAERERAEEQARAAVRLRRRAVVLAFAVLLAAVAAVAAFILYGNAEFQRRQADEQRRIADLARAKADSSAAAEKIAREKAQIAEQIAIEEKDRAERERQRADAQRALAEQRKLEAEKRRQEAEEAKKFAEAQRNRADQLREEAERLRDISIARYLAAQAPLEEDDTLAVLLAHQAFLFNERTQGNLDAEVYDALRETLNRPSFKAGGPDTLARHKDWGRAVVFGPKGLMMASGSADSSIKLWRLDKDRLNAQTLRGHNGSVRTLAFAPDGVLLASGGDDHTVRLWNLNKPSAASRILRGHRDWVWTVAFSPDGNLLASGSLDNTVRLWHVDDAEGRADTLRGHTGSVRTLAISTDGRRLASGSSDNTVRVWDMTRPQNSPLILKHDDRVRAVAFSPEGNYLACGDDENRVWLWDLKQPDEAHRCEFRGHKGPINALAFSPDGKVLASGSSDGTAKLWEVKKPEIGPLASLPHDSWVWSLAFNLDATQLATASSDNAVRLWVTRLDILAKRAREKAKRNLTPAEREKYIGGKASYQ